MIRTRDDGGLVSEFGVRWGVRPSRLHGPPPRTSDVARVELLDRLDASGARLVTLVAPAGYGKTTLGAQYAAIDPRPTAWLSMTEECNDVVTLMRSLVLALSAAIRIDETLRLELTTARPRSSVMTAGACASVHDAAEPFLLVIDDLHALMDPAGIEVLSAIVEETPPGSRVIVASRSLELLPLARKRMSDEILELGPADLAFSVDEAAALLRGGGATDIAREDVVALADQTEGWAVGLQIAALSRSWGTDAGETPPFRGDDRFMADYLRENVLTQLPDDTVDFLVRTSVLDEMTGPLCDATLGITASAARLEALEDANLMLVPLDHRRERYRYHHLFHDLLRMELEHRRPGDVADLNARASTWCEEHGDYDLAITYARAGNLSDRVAELFGRYAQLAYFSGRRGDVLRWAHWLDEHATLEDHPFVAAIGGWAMVMEGGRFEADRWADAATRSTQDRSDEAQACLLLLRALMCRDGVEPMRDDVERAFELLAPMSPWVPNATILRGLVELMMGDVAAGERSFERGAQLAAEMGTAPALTIALAELAVLALGRGDMETAAAHSRRSMEIIDAGHLHGYATSVLPLAVAARVAIVQGDHIRARRSAEEAADDRSMVTDAFPSLALQVRIQLIWNALALFDIEGARAYLAEADDLVRDCRGLGALETELEAVRRQVDGFHARSGAPSLSPAEARLLPFLTTHLSFREIGGELHVSQNTVKTEAISIYRKLGVTSRAAAVEVARGIGLLA